MRKAVHYLLNSEPHDQPAIQHTLSLAVQMSATQVKQELQLRYERDVDPPQSELGAYIANEMQIKGYK